MSNEREAVNIDEAVRFEMQRVKRAMELSAGDNEDLITYAKEVVSLRYPSPAVFASRYDEDLGECVPVEVDPPMLAKLRERVAVERKAEPVAWQWCAYEDGSQRTSWYPEGDSYQAGWEELAKKYPDKYQVVTRPLYSTPPAALVERKAEPVAVPEDATPAMIAAALAVDWSNESEEATAHNVWHAFRSSLSASPSPVDSRDGLITDAMVKAYKEAYLKHCDDALNGRIPRAEDFTFEASRKGIAAALAAKEQQP